ncbi:hypothetical protein ABEI05_22860 [Erwinia billingiae]|uniref:hypothetical protein n=1 Tax=Erwinia billingiae TaxID=182337 RepID=UPI003208BB35
MFISYWVLGLVAVFCIAVLHQKDKRIQHLRSDVEDLTISLKLARANSEQHYAAARRAFEGLFHVNQLIGKLWNTLNMSKDDTCEELCRIADIAVDFYYDKNADHDNPPWKEI